MKMKGQVRDWLKANHVWMKVLSLLLAVLLWFYVMDVEDPQRDYTVYDVPVQLIGADQLQEKYNLALASNETPTVDLKLRGTITRLAGVTKDNITVRADITGITEAGDYEVAYDVSYITGVTIAESSPAEIALTIEDIITVKLPVQVNKVGKLADGLETDKAIVDPIEVEVTGIRSQLENAYRAYVNISADQLTDTFEGDVEYIIVDEEEHELKGFSITKATPTINVRIPVYMVKEVPLTVDLVEGSGAAASDATVTVTPSYVKITGSIADVVPVTELKLGTVDLNTFSLAYSATMLVSLPDNVYLKDAVTEALVDVRLASLDTAQINVDSIEVLNMPVGKSVDVETISVVVTLRGKPDKLKGLTADDLKIVVDLKDQTIIDGRQLVKAQAVIKTAIDDVGIFGSYTVIINVNPVQEGPIVTS